MKGRLAFPALDPTLRHTGVRDRPFIKYFEIGGKP
jgi:hypothetical protein